ncbi:MAG: hypothetical protein HY776_02225 [Actinobacteria bacterium]|nr:hypothetical protein [Actinomycetota bacterium]
MENIQTKELSKVADLPRQRQINPQNIHLFSEREWRALLAKHHRAVEKRLDLWLRRQAAKECEL